MNLSVGLTKITKTSEQPVLGQKLEAGACLINIIEAKRCVTTLSDRNSAIDVKRALYRAMQSRTAELKATRGHRLLHKLNYYSPKHKLKKRHYSKQTCKVSQLPE
jgi:hypothetical protein